MQNKVVDCYGIVARGYKMFNLDVIDARSLIITLLMRKVRCLIVTLLSRANIRYLILMLLSRAVYVLID